ncbi:MULTISPECIES: DUF2808 domain-containing protein [Prochlorococcus]|uniref:DUF2808 domain-containing protein n=1 Tax=Prochlorococcus marinus str. MIT 9116 TaxID=167544 RepID=A0A0A1ZUD5_PROMR|nr:DUF2808 domain-containing protein [Prochlorococcus marinus]KGF91933.1 hypothetical protein EU92_0231 [Prochlorococcus marinus str. MIT 9107]KGF93020.1 hypothetical protein EU93_0194 [Prochlorococcus marinus str. MIT 9116]KGF94022.1 hypothetical protein EU94_0928 [Prochlorococcus marinus str. MIT 9123]
MLKQTKKVALNSQILKFLLIPTILLSTPFFYKSQEAKAGLEFQWDQDSGFRRLKWLQKQNQKRLRNTIYFFLRPADRQTELLKINLTIPKPFKSPLNKEKISFCKVRIGGFENRTKCLEDIPADIEINTDESSLRSINIYPYKPIPNDKESYAIVLKVFNPNKTGLFQFHSYGQYKGESVSSYLGSWTIVID